MDRVKKLAAIILDILDLSLDGAPMTFDDMHDMIEVVASVSACLIAGDENYTAMFERELEAYIDAFARARQQPEAQTDESQIAMEVE